MKKAPKRGAHVSWESSQGTVTGTVERTLTKPATIKSHHVAASPEHPEILVKSDTTGALAAHTAEALKPARKTKRAKRTT
jgi:hypothetical protein